MTKSKFYTKINDEDTDYPKFLRFKHDMEEMVLSGGYTYYTIPLEHCYRPDLIAQLFYGNAQLDWVLSIANRFYNTIEDFTTDDVIKIPNSAYIKGLI